MHLLLPSRATSRVWCPFSREENNGWLSATQGHYLAVWASLFDFELPPQKSLSMGSWTSTSFTISCALAGIPDQMGSTQVTTSTKAHHCPGLVLTGEVPTATTGGLGQVSRPPDGRLSLAAGWWQAEWLTWLWKAVKAAWHPGSAGQGACRTVETASEFWVMGCLLWGQPPSPTALGSYPVWKGFNLDRIRVK